MKIYCLISSIFTSLITALAMFVMLKSGGIELIRMDVEKLKKDIISIGIDVNNLKVSSKRDHDLLSKRLFDLYPSANKRSFLDRLKFYEK